MVPAIAVPGVIAVASFGAAATIGVVRFSASALTAVVAIDFLFLLSSSVLSSSERRWAGAASYCLGSLRYSPSGRSRIHRPGSRCLSLPLYLLTDSYRTA
jgi:hypothetical protein